jgi:Peptidase family M1 domain
VRRRRRYASRYTRAAVAVAVAAGLAGCTPSAVAGLPDPGASPPATAEPNPPPRADPPHGELPQGEPPPAPRLTGDPPGCPVGGAGPGADDPGGDDPGRLIAYEQTRPGASRAAPRARPWKDRPVVRLCFAVPADRRVVQGAETVTFTPDRRTCEVIFRAWPNKPETAAAGNRLEVTAAAVGGRPVQPRVEAAGAPRGVPGTLVRVPVSRCVPAGGEVTIDLAFTLTLGADGGDRVGYSTGDRTAWMATAFPLLAWVRGSGWATEPAVKLFGETVTSEEFRLASLDVVAPKDDQVLGTGQAGPTAPGPDGTVVHRFTAASVRDVAVTVGRLTVVERTVEGVRLHVGAPAGTVRSPEAWADATEVAITNLSRYLGPFPYDDLWVTIAPDIPTGIEFPGAIQFGDVNPARTPELVPHEVAHMWFYGLVGNNQARDPWLDESFAVYAETLAAGNARLLLRLPTPPPVRNRVGESMQWYARLPSPDMYGSGVYLQGGAMLHRARQAAGPATFDQLLRDYIDANAHQVATDDDVARAFGSAPKVLRILRQYGALP